MVANYLPSNIEWVERRDAVPADPTSPSPYERDRARIIHSSAYRKLQAKTQVLGIGEGDFHRTRLTHSQEVAQIGRGIVSQLNRNPELDKLGWLTWLPDPDLIEAICLAHDLGHPPFGHGGEVALDFCMRSSGGFEGNGQTLRVVSRLESHTPQHGLNLTRRCLLGLLKYPAPYSSLCKHPQTDEKRPPLGWKPPKCFHDEEAALVEWIISPFTGQDRDHLMAFDENEEKHSKTKYKSLDCSIMDIADEIAYGVHDLEDAVVLGLIDKNDWETTGLDGHLERGLELRDVSNDMFGEDRCARKGMIGRMVHSLMLALAIEPIEQFTHPLLRYKITLSSPAESALKELCNLVYKKVVLRPQVRTLEWRGQEHVRKMFEVFSTHGSELIPEHHMATAGAPTAREIADYIAGMTDEYATRMFERLFTPRQRTVHDRL